MKKKMGYKIYDLPPSSAQKSLESIVSWGLQTTVSISGFLSEQIHGLRALAGQRNTQLLKMTSCQMATETGMLLLPSCK